MKKLIAFFTLVVSLYLIGCKKDEPATKTALLTAGPWRRTAVMAEPGIPDANGNTIKDQYAQYKPCVKDNLVRFETPDVFIFDDGTTKCDPNDQQTLSYLWSFNADETIITIDRYGDKTEFTLLELTDKQLKYSYWTSSARARHLITETLARK